jgi:predicted nucleic acid-binding protein
MPHPKRDSRVFLDANVLFSAAYREQAGLAILWKLRRIRLLTSLYAAQEAVNNLGEEDQQSRLRVLLEDVETVPGEAGMSATVQASLAKIVLPDKDRPILAAAVAAKADFLLTGDIRHFGSYFNQIVCGVRILRPAEFLKSFSR